MKKRLPLSTVLALIILLSIVSQASAITGQMGNSRMVLRLNVGEEARRYLLIENVNDVPITIELLSTGDLADSVQIEENSFILQPGEEKKAYFTITADRAGTTETKINVMFKPPQGSGVGLSANIIVITDGAVDSAIDDTNQGSEDNTGSDTSNQNGQETDTQPPAGNTGFTPITMLTVTSLVLIAVFVILLVFSGRKLNQKKRSGRPRD
ncbi:MAG: hypothetical protein KKD18_05545 [Nanoarchaeota archaeon]|nr:hypothetical protein [Nanoarchaeota archaeon]